MELSDLDAIENGLRLKQGFPTADKFRKLFEETCKRKFIFGSGFEPYGGVAGLYDFGPIGCALKANILNHWRNWFVLHDDLVELDTTNVTPSCVFETSQHVERFTDVMARDVKTGIPVRVDKLIEDECEKRLGAKGAPAVGTPEEKRLREHHGNAGAYSIEEMKAALVELNIKSPGGNDLTEPYPQNLMFKTAIGAAGDQVGYLRPELAQGIILNFKRMLEFNNGKMPFGGACIGTAFRNEIAPRSGLIRVREFPLAEIEYFVHPSMKAVWPGFESVADVHLPLQSQEHQLKFQSAEVMSLREAVARGIIGNQALAYWIGRTALFLESIGLRYIRFRQHRKTEMAHYAADCWDAELLSSNGWVECVGLADRSAFDLSAHNAATGAGLTARLEYDAPVITNEVVVKSNKALINKTFRGTAAACLAHLDALTGDAAEALSVRLHGTAPSSDAVAALAAALPTDGDAVVVTVGDVAYPVTKEMFSAKMEAVKTTGENYIPHVIEPSFGIGRIIYCTLEQTYWARAAAAADDKKDKDVGAERTVFSLPPGMAPFKVSILPLQREDRYEAVLTQLRRALQACGVSCKVDASAATIGKRYARSDEVGVPFAVTVDPDTLTDGTVTIRERDSCEQIRVPLAEAAALLDRLTRTAPVNSDVAISQSPCTRRALGLTGKAPAPAGLASWADAVAQYPIQAQTASAAVGAAAAAEKIVKAAEARRAWPEVETIALQAQITAQGDRVRAMKGAKVEKDILVPEVDKLKLLKKLLDDGPADADAAPAAALAAELAKLGL